MELNHFLIFLSFFALSWELFVVNPGIKHWSHWSSFYADLSDISWCSYPTYRTNINLEIKHWSLYLKIGYRDQAFKIKNIRTKVPTYEDRTFVFWILESSSFLSMSQFFSRFYFLWHSFLFYMFSYFFCNTCFVLFLFVPIFCLFFYFTFCLMCAFFVCLINFVLFNLYVLLGYLIKKHTNQFF